MIPRLPHNFLSAILWPTALLPLPLLYLCADVAAFVLHRLVRYRLKVVRNNLRLCFPEETDARLRVIEKSFYRNLADYVVETLKLLHISDRQMTRRMHFEGLDLIEKPLAEGRSVAVYFSHCGNWEWAPSVTLHIKPEINGVPVDFCQVYRPLRSRLFDRLMLKVRSRFGSLSFQKKTVFRDLLNLKRESHLSVTGFMSDQKPSHGDPTFVTTFLNRPTAMITGTETLARKMGMAAVYWDMYKDSRGHYRIVCRPIADNVATTQPGEVTALYTRLLQNTIERNPAIWLWSHNRWKYPVKLPDNAQ